MIDEIAEDEEKDGDGDNGADAGHGEHEAAHEFSPTQIGAHAWPIPLPRCEVDDNQQPRQAVEDEGEQEQHQAEFDQRLEIEVAGGFGEFVGDDGGDGVARRKQRGTDGGRVADDHGDRHGFAQSARQRQENGAHDAGPRKRNNDLPGGFPASGAQAPERLRADRAAPKAALRARPK